MNTDNDYLKRRLALLRWALPISLFVLALTYQLSLNRVEETFGETGHFIIEFIIYGTSGPVLIFISLSFINRWMEDKERAEKQVLNTERRLSSITKALADAIIVLDSQGCVVSCNPGTEALLSYSEEDLRGQPFNNLTRDKITLPTGDMESADPGVPENIIREIETVCCDKHGKEVETELTTSQLVDGDGKFTGVLVILRDITQRKQNEREIQLLNASLNEKIAEKTQELSNKLEELAQVNAELEKQDELRSEFVALVTHQIRAPLTNLSGALERMQMNCSDANLTCSKMFSILSNQSQRLERLVQDVLNAANLESGKLNLYPEPISMQPVVRQVVEQMRARVTDRQLKLPPENTQPLVYADRDRLAEILTNLLDNADKYSPRGRDIVINMHIENYDMILSVRDFGSGVKVSSLDHLFEKYYREDTSDSQSVYGFGLGLYVCKRLIEAQNGRIWAENAADGGAIFSISLPLAR